MQTRCIFVFFRQILALLHVAVYLLEEFKVLWFQAYFLAFFISVVQGTKFTSVCGFRYY